MKKETAKNYAFIDSQNLNLAILDLGWKLDYKRFRVYLADKFKVKKAFLFIGYVEKNQKLYKFLKDSGYKLIFKPTLEYKKDRKSFTKGNVDAELVLHTMIELSNFDKAIIISGDGDFFCLIEYLVGKNKFLNLIIPNPNRYSALLRKFRQYFVYIHKLEKKLGQSKKEGSDLRTKP
jgi:uncharacterized LabA/DUF88 family protein